MVEFSDKNQKNTSETVQQQLEERMQPKALQSSQTQTIGSRSKPPASQSSPAENAVHGVFSRLGNYRTQQLLNQPTTNILQRQTIQGLQTVIGNQATQRLLRGERNTDAHISSLIQPYRKKGAFNFGVSNTSTLKEDSFRFKRDKRNKPWIKKIVITFDKVKTDSNGDEIPEGQLVATYFANKETLADITLTVTGGPKGLKSDPGTYTVHRIEGEGYNDPAAAAATPASKLEGPKRGGRRRYSKPDPITGQRSASMNWAVFYNRGEAIHDGFLDVGSHGCIHVDSSSLVQLNYHSVIGHTKVTVKYSGAAKTKFFP